MLKAVYTINGRKKNNELVSMIKSGLSDLKNEIERMSEDETKIEKPYEIVDIVEKILEFNRKNQEGQGLKMLKPNQMLSGLSISLAQFKTGNNLEKLKNKTRLLLYSLYRSKKLTKTIYLKMETIFLSTENSKIIEPHRFRLTLAEKLSLKDFNKNIALTNLSIHYTWKNIKSVYNNNKFKIFAPTWNDEFDLPDGSYSIAGIQDYFEFIIKKHETLTENSPVQIYPNKIKNGIVFKVTTG